VDEVCLQNLDGLGPDDIFIMERKKYDVIVKEKGDCLLFNDRK